MEIVTTIKSKADALVFAINKATEHTQSFDKEKVDEIYNYILSKVELPDVERDMSNAYLDTLNGMIGKYSSFLDGMSPEMDKQ